MSAVRTQSVITKRKIRLFVNKSNMQWIVLDDEGTFWALSKEADPWQQRQEIMVTDQDKLEPVPEHYKHMLGIPS